MAKIKLSDEAIRRLPTPANGTAYYSDSALRGFQIAVGRQKRVFYLLRWFNGRNQRHKIGEWCPPMFTAGQARKKAEELIGNIVRGDDPRVKRDGTLSEWLEDYIETYSHSSYDRLTVETADEYRKALELYCGPEKQVKRGKVVKRVRCGWMKRDIRKISHEDIAALHRRMIDTPCSANHLVRVIRSIQRHAGITPPSKFPWYKQRRRENGVKPEARSAFGQMLLSIENPIRRGVWLLGCYTGIRRENLCSLQWEQVDLDAGTLHLPKMKNKHARTMPLSPQAVAALRPLVGLDAEWVFPSPSQSRTGYINEVRDKAIPETITFHDTRRIFTEAGGECLIPEYAIQYLRGDVVNQSMSQRYMSHLDLRDPIKKIGKRIEQQLFPPKAAHMSLAA